MLCIFLIPCVAGSAMLYGLGRSKADEGPLLAGYYLIAFLFACNPLIVAWIASNVAGQTKKAAMMALYQAGSSSGNIVGPLLFKTKDKPAYRPGLQAVMGIFVASMGLVLILMGMFMVMNKRKEVERVKNGKPAKIHDRSMDTKYVAAEQTPEDEEDGIKGTTALGSNAFKDISDFKVGSCALGGGGRVFRSFALTSNSLATLFFPFTQNDEFVVSVPSCPVFCGSHQLTIFLPLLRSTPSELWPFRLPLISLSPACLLLGDLRRYLLLYQVIL